MMTFNKDMRDDLREKYLKVRKLLDENNENDPEGPDCETKNKATSILKEMKMRLENVLNNSTDDNKLDIISMLAIIWLNIGIICFDNEELKDGEDNLMQCIEILKGHELEPQCILQVLSALNKLGIIWFRWGEYEKSKAFVDKSEKLYKDFKNLDPPRAPIGMSEMFGIKSEDEPAAQDVLEKLHTLTLYYIAQIYGFCKEPKKSALYCHMTLQRQLELTDLDYIDWALNAATLSQFFMETKHFAQARHHLAASSHILKQYENSLIDDTDENDEVKAAKWEQFKHRSADVARCWAKYGILLMSMSRDRLIELSENIDDEKEPNNDESKTDETTEFADIELQKLKFEKLEEFIAPIAEQITDKYLLDFNDARKVFLNVQQWLDQAKKYYALETHASDYVHIIQDMSLAYKHLSFFEDCEDRQAKMHKRRIDLLEHVIKELNPRYYQTECRQIWIELGEAYSTILDIKLDKLRASDERPTPHALNKINTLCKSAIKYNQEFLDSLKESESAPPPTEFPEEIVHSALYAYFRIGALHNKLITPDKHAQITILQNSMNAYNFFINYCSTHPEAAEFMKNELNVCKELLPLLHLKLDKMKQLLSEP